MQSLTIFLNQKHLDLSREIGHRMHILSSTLCHQRNEKIFSCFVDFSKAFDTIPRELLFKKLLGYGINGKFFNNIKTLYSNDNCCIKVGREVTETFLANQGVKQGCILSPPSSTVLGLTNAGL